MIFDERPPLTRTDKLFGLALVGILVLTTVCYELTDGAALRAAAQEADKPPAVVAERLPLRTDSTVFYGETPNAALLPPAMNNVTLIARKLTEDTLPMSQELQAVLREACEVSGVPVHLALGLIETESGFDPEADNGLCFGLCQLNKRYYSADLTPTENIRAGVAHLGALLEEYSGDTAAALTAYNAGYDTSGRTYANTVLAAAEKWRGTMK